IRVGKRGIGREHANERTELRYIGLKATTRIGACSIHGGGRSRLRCGMKGRDLDEYQTGAESHDEGHYGRGDRDPKGQHLVSSTGHMASSTPPNTHTKTTHPIAMTLTICPNTEVSGLVTAASLCKLADPSYGAEQPQDISMIQIKAHALSPG